MIVNFFGHLAECVIKEKIAVQFSILTNHRSHGVNAGNAKSQCKKPHACYDDFAKSRRDKCSQGKDHSIKAIKADSDHRKDRNYHRRLIEEDGELAEDKPSGSIDDPFEAKHRHSEHPRHVQCDHQIRNGHVNNVEIHSGPHALVLSHNSDNHGVSNQRYDDYEAIWKNTSDFDGH